MKEYSYGREGARGIKTLGLSLLLFLLLLLLHTQAGEEATRTRLSVEVSLPEYIVGRGKFESGLKEQ